MQAFGQGLDVLLSDYTENSVVFTPNGPERRLDEIRVFLAAFLNSLPLGMMEAMQIIRQDIDGETAYFLWKAEPFAPLGADTFVVRNGKIMAHTFAAYMPS